MKCPVCQAEQAAADQCRRCRADLSAVVAVRRAVALGSLNALVNTATANRSLERDLATLCWLAPDLAETFTALDASADAPSRTIQESGECL